VTQSETRPDTRRDYGRRALSLGSSHPFNPVILRRGRCAPERPPGASLTAPPGFVPAGRPDALRGDVEAFDALCRARPLRPPGR
jgi:hypothetical protein